MLLLFFCKTIVLYFSGSTNYLNQKVHRSFTDLIISHGTSVDQTPVLNTEIINQALANDSLTNLDLNTGTSQL